MEPIVTTFEYNLTLPPDPRPNKALPKSIVADIEAARTLRQWLLDQGVAIELIVTGERAIQFLEAAASEPFLGADLETTAATRPPHPRGGLIADTRVTSIRLMQLFNPQTRACAVIDMARTGHAWLARVQWPTLIFHNAKFDLGQLWQVFQTEIPFEDTMLAHRVIHGENVSLASLANNTLGLSISKALQTSDWSREHLLPEQIDYAAADAVLAATLWPYLDSALDQDRDAYSLLHALVYPVLRQAPVRLDIESHSELVSQWDREIASAEATLRQRGVSKPGSTQQRQKYLEQHLPTEFLFDWPLTETGKLSTKSKDLEIAAHIDGVRELGVYSKLYSYRATLGSKLIENSIDGDLFPSFSIARATTGRFTCAEPNLQNIPRRGFKNLILPPHGKVFVGGDLGQIELRVAAQLADEDVINDAYANGADLHRQMAAEITNKAPADVTNEERQMAKAANFGLLYGAGAETLRIYAANSYGVQMSVDQARETKAVFHRTYPRLTEWQQEVVSDANAWGFSASKHSRLRRHFSNDVYTHAMNHPVQSTAWEILALAIIEMDKRMPIGCVITHHVHDELVVACLPEQVTAVSELLAEVLTAAFFKIFPAASTRGLIEVKSAPDWAGLK
jgi:DNA polymerase-1